MGSRLAYETESDSAAITVDHSMERAIVGIPMVEVQEGLLLLFLLRPSCVVQAACFCLNTQ